MSNPPETTPARCPDCGLTEAELRTHGLMGCATCYRVFEAVVVQAAAELHGVPPEVMLPPARPALPWPTRRAESSPAPPLDLSAAPETRRPRAEKR